MKKTIKFSLALLLAAMLATSCGGTDETSATPATEAPTVQEEQEQDEVEVTDDEPEEVSASVNEQKYLQIGDINTYTYSEASGTARVEVTDIGMVAVSVADYVSGTDYESFGTEFYVLYTYLDITNLTDSEISTRSGDTNCYVDDYVYAGGALDSNVLTRSGIDTSFTTIPPERKAIVTYTSVIDKDTADSAGKIEVDILDGADSILFKEDGQWLYGDYAQTSSTSTEGGIGNPVIDSNPDKYIPDGVTGSIDVIDESFYADTGNYKTPVAGTWIEVGGGGVVIEITAPSDEHGWLMSFTSNNYKDDAMNLILEPAGNGSPSFWASSDNDFYIVSFFDGGMYVHTQSPDDWDDYIEGFYELL